MGDPLFSDLNYDEYTIKSEPLGMDSVTYNSGSASVPIPSRRMQNTFGLYDPSPNSSSFHDNNLAGNSLYSGTSLWNTKLETKMEDDDIFQVDKSDLIQGPTLAELNAANDENFLEDLNFDELLLPEDASIHLGSPADINQPQSPQQQVQQSLTVNISYPNNLALSFPPQSSTLTQLKVGSQPNSLFNTNYTAFKEVPSPNSVEILVSGDAQHSPGPSSPFLQPSQSPVPSVSPQRVSPLAQSKPQSGTSTLHELLMKQSIQQQQQQLILGQSVPSRSNSMGTSKRPAHISRLSSSAPTHCNLEQLWARREPRQHLLSTSSLAEAGSTSSLSTDVTGIMSPDAQDFSLDENESDDDSDRDYDDSSDAESQSDGEGSTRSGASSAKKERFFWQYNVQSKGPKGQRLVLRSKMEDPHYLDQITDPVFSPECSVQGIKHSGKARKGDGNDLTPNPKKLNTIGKELDKLSKTINDMTPVSELPFNVRPKSRKEKNKLASRACRLKKKAQHEANKLKLYGLECEHKRLMGILQQMKQLLILKVSPNPPDSVEANKTIDKLLKQANKIRVAGQTTEFVNRILDKLKSGIANGGLDELHHST